MPARNMSIRMPEPLLEQIDRLVAEKDKGATRSSVVRELLASGLRMLADSASSAGMIVIGDRRYYSYARAAAMMHVRPLTLKNWRSRGEIRGTMIGQWCYVEEAELLRRLDELTDPPRPQNRQEG